MVQAFVVDEIVFNELHWLVTDVVGLAARLLAPWEVVVIVTVDWTVIVVVCVLAERVCETVEVGGVTISMVLAVV